MITYVFLLNGAVIDIFCALFFCLKESKKKIQKVFWTKY